MCAGTAAADPDYGSFTGHPMDPRTPEPEEGLTSLQPLGDAQALVEFDLGAFGTPCITGAYMVGEFIDVTEFSPARVARWYEAICAELQASREESEHAQAWIDSQAGEL